MNKLKKWLSNILLQLDFVLLMWAARLSSEESEAECKTEELKKELKEEAEFPYSFKTFAEGLASNSYTVRHDAAAKVISYYIDQKGSPHVDDILKAARIILEDTLATEGDVSYLVGAWKDQASAVTEEERIQAEEREEKIYSDLAKKLQTKN